MEVTLIALAIFSGLGAGIALGFYLGQKYLLKLQANGSIVPINPWALPIVDQQQKETELRTILTPTGTKVKKTITEEGTLNTIKNPRNDSKEKPYI